MSRRTLAAGLIAAALGSPAAAQAPNPWRGETAALPTAPAPRAVAPKPTRQLIIGVGFNSVTGLTGTVVYRDAAGVVVAPPPREVTRRPIPTPGSSGITYDAPPPALKPLVLPAGEVTLPAAWYLERVPRGAPPAPRYMPPPAPLPVERRQ